ncbi:MAG: DNRLRE domain-containing protein [Verrucomicrobia bacterium]|nr:DNRLRE domain-containing protein [Verrucomicrobiota bacterium]
MNWLKFIFRLCLLLGGAAVALSHASADTVTLSPVADAEIRQFSPTSNFGSDVTMVPGVLGFTAGQEIRRALLRFDFGGPTIPAGAIINSVTVKVKVVKVPSGAANSTFDLRRLLQSWSEAGVTWNSRSSPNTPWQLPGATGAADSIPSASSTVFVTGRGTYTFPSTTSLVNDIQSWVNNPGTNFGWLLISENETTAKTARHFGTHEDPNNTPTLVIDFSVPPGISVQPRSQTVSEGDTVTNTVQATGTPPLSYQWQFNTNDIPGATNSVLVLPNVQTNDTGFYTVIVRNSAGSVVSQPATLNVFPRSAFQPMVTVISPANGALFPLNSNVLVVAVATVSELASNATITQMEFFTNGISVGITTNNPASLVLSNLAAGDFDLTAHATDSQGHVGLSTNPVAIRVLAPPLPLLVAPPSGVRFALGTNIAVTTAILPPALSADVARVQFFANGSFVGESLSASSNLFSIHWTPTVEQDYVLTAVATDILGQTGSSAPVTNRVLVFEFVKPTIAITNSPPNFARLMSSQVFLSGTADDNQHLEFVELVVNGVVAKAIGTTNWQAEITLIPGPNTIRVHSVDFNGNVSFDATRFFFYVVTSPLQVETRGAGTVTPDLTPRPLEIGQVYTLSAVPDVGSVFDGWEAAINSIWEKVANSNNATLSFVMQSNLTLRANFISNPFSSLLGTYAGLFYDHDTNTIAPESSGVFTLQVGGLGEFSGKLTINGASYSYRGRFNNQRQATLPVLRRQLAPAVLNFYFDPADTAGQIHGTVTVLINVNVTNVVDGTNIITLTNILRTAELLGYRSVFQFSSPPAPQAGAYPFHLVREDNALEVGTGMAKINSSGQVRLRGSLDGRKFSAATSLGQNGDCPFYVSPRGGSETVLGWLNFTNAPPVSVAGKLFWIESGAGGPLFQVDVVPSQP